MLHDLLSRRSWRELARAAADEDEDHRALVLLTDAVVQAIRSSRLPDGCIRRVWRAARAAGYGLSDIA
jgi:hypothetical protein